MSLRCALPAMLLALGGCGGRTAGGGDSGADAELVAPDHCPNGGEDGGADCTLAEVIGRDEYNVPVPYGGTTACPSTAGSARDLPQTTALRVRSSGWGYAHSHDASVCFSPIEATCALDGLMAKVLFNDVGAGTYEVVDRSMQCETADGRTMTSPRCLGELAARATHGPWAGTGLLVLEPRDSENLRGSADVVFEDGCRLLADFFAPLCWIE